MCQLCLLRDEPTSFVEAERSPRWRKGRMEEMMSIEENDT
jgi:hypothetical protein